MHTETTRTPPATALLLGPAADEAEGELAQLYRQTRQAFGFLPNAARLFGVSPPLLKEQMRAIEFYRDHPSLGPTLPAFIRLLVSHRARCRYCVDMNRVILLQAGIAPEAIDAALEDPMAAPLPEKQGGLLTFVVRAVADPHAIDSEDVARVRALGWSDAELFEATYHGARALAVDTLFAAFDVPSD